MSIRPARERRRPQWQIDESIIWADERDDENKPPGVPHVIVEVHAPPKPEKVRRPPKGGKAPAKERPKGGGHRQAPGGKIEPSVQAAQIISGDTSGIVMEKQGDREYLDETEVATWGFLKDAKLRVFKVPGGEVLFDLDPSSYDKFRWAAKHTRRLLTGEPVNVAIAAKESFGPKLKCEVCDQKTGQPVYGRDGTTVLYYLRTPHFGIDHTRPEEPSYYRTKTKGVLLEQLKEGAARILCLDCEAYYTRDAGNTSSHHYDPNSAGTLVQKRKSATE